MIPTPRFHAHLQVGTDYEGPTITPLPEYMALEQRLASAYPGRFADPLSRTNPEFAQTYIFSLLQAAIARCAQEDIYELDSDTVDGVITEFVAVLDEDSYEVVCCRVVSHLSTDRLLPLKLGEVTIIPEENSLSSLAREICRHIPAAPAVLSRDTLMFYDPPHALLMARERVTNPNPYDAAGQVSAEIDAFLLRHRLLTAGTGQSVYQVVGTSTLVSRLSPQLRQYPTQSLLPAQVSRAPCLSSADAAPHDALTRLIKEAAIKREGFVFSAFDMAVYRLTTSYRADDPLEILVDLAAGLEAALSSEGGDNEALTLRLRSRAAALLAAGSDPAHAIFGDIGALYGLRSSMIHGGPLRESKLISAVRKISTVPDHDAPGVATTRALDRLRDLLRRAILARLCLAAGAEPLWPFSSKLDIELQLSDSTTREQWRSSWRKLLADLGARQAAEPSATPTDFLPTHRDEQSATTRPPGHPDGTDHT